MKKIIAILILIFLITGCTQKKLDIKSSDITSITLNEDGIQKSDFDDVYQALKDIKFHQIKDLNSATDILNIHLTDTVYTMKISENLYMSYTIKDKHYITKETTKVKKLMDKLEDKIKKYKDSSFFTMSELTEYKEDDNGFFIRLDKSNQYLKLTSKKSLRNFKIHRIEKQGNNYNDIDLLYEHAIVTSDEPFIIRYQYKVPTPGIRITFDSPEGYTFSILPIFNQKDFKLDYKISVKAKENA